MKLIYKIIIRVLIALTAIVSIWALFFYFIIINEVYDEIDDNLDDYSEMIIERFNSGERLPEQNNGTNNSYHIELISSSVVDIELGSSSSNDMVYIVDKDEREPARVLKTLFHSSDGKTYRLSVYTPSIEHEDLLTAIFQAIVYLFVLLLVTLVLINVWVYKTSVSPMYKVLEWLRLYKLGGDNKPLLNPTNIVEFNELNATISESIMRIEKSYMEQKQFISNASHEMQTPLAICQNRLESLMGTDLKEEQLSEIIKTQQTIDYMKKLNKALLLLSKIENQQFRDVEKVNFNTIIESLVVDFREVYASQHIQVNVISEGDLVVDMNMVLAKTLIINLIKNAFIHNADSGEVTIHISPRRMIFENSGTQALDSPQIFTRFYQGNKSKNSTGLGLAIVSSVCKENGFALAYSFEQNKHQFKVTFQ